MSYIEENKAKSKYYFWIIIFSNNFGLIWRLQKSKLGLEMKNVFDNDFCS